MTFYGSERIQQLLTYLKNYLTEKFAAKQDKLTFDAVPTENSMNPVRSGGVYDALSEINIDTVEDMIAPQFDTNTTYSVDDYVIYNNQLYKCIVRHSAGEWNASHFEISNISSPIKNMANKTDINGTFSNMINFLGAKNLLNITVETITKGSITYTINKNSYGDVTYIHIGGTQPKTKEESDATILQIGVYSTKRNEDLKFTIGQNGVGDIDSSNPANNDVIMRAEYGREYDGNTQSSDFSIAYLGTYGFVDAFRNPGTHYFCLYVQDSTRDAIVDVNFYPMLTNRYVQATTSTFIPHTLTNLEITHRLRNHLELIKHIDTCGYVVSDLFKPVCDIYFIIAYVEYQDTASSDYSRPRILSHVVSYETLKTIAKLHYDDYYNLYDFSYGDTPWFSTSASFTDNYTKISFAGSFEKNPNKYDTKGQLWIYGLRK